MPQDRTGDSEAEKGVVYEVLARDQPMRQAELFDLLSGQFPSAHITAAIFSLETAGVVVTRGDTVEASDPCKRLDELGLLHV